MERGIAKCMAVERRGGGEGREVGAEVEALERLSLIGRGRTGDTGSRVHWEKAVGRVIRQVLRWTGVIRQVLRWTGVIKQVLRWTGEKEGGRVEREIGGCNIKGGEQWYPGAEKRRD